jgi:hypothetical protein
MRILGDKQKYHQVDWKVASSPIHIRCFGIREPRIFGKIVMAQCTFFYMNN